MDLQPQQQPEQSSSFSPTSLHLPPKSNVASASPASPPPGSPASTAAEQSAPRLPYDMTGLFGHMSDAPTLNGVSVPSPQAQAAGPTASAPTTAAHSSPSAAGPAALASVPPDAAAYTGGLDAKLDTRIAGNRTERTLLDTQHKSHSADADKTEQQLNTDRQKLLTDLTTRSQAFDTEIKSVQDKLGNHVPKSPTPEQKVLLNQLGTLVKQKEKYSAQKTALERWHERGEINEINTKLQDPKLDAKVRTQLLAHKKELAHNLLSTTQLFQQFDPKWGDTVYGKDRSYTTMTEAGCGPTSLAMMLDFRDQEDPEGNHAAGKPNAITPRTVANYATNHGRVKGSGTDGETMMNDLGQGFAGYHGNSIADQTGVRESLGNGVPVMFLGHDVTGKKGDGKDSKPYGGHYMVLNGVSDDGKSYNVLDGGRNSERNIQTITSKQLSGHTNGYWNVAPDSPAKNVTVPPATT